MPSTPSESPRFGEETAPTPGRAPTRSLSRPPRRGAPQEPEPEPESEAPATANQDLALAATSLFGGTTNRVTLRSGEVVTVYPAKVRQLSMVIDLFSRIVLSLDQEALGALVTMISDEQKKAIADGKDPNSIDMGELAQAKMVRTAFGNVSLLRQLFMSVMDGLPELVVSFTSMSAESFQDLEIDEGMLVMGGIFMLNYSFFTQKLPPMLTAFTQSQAGRLDQSVSKSPGPNGAIHRRR